MLWALPLYEGVCARKPIEGKRTIRNERGKNMADKERHPLDDFLRKIDDALLEGFERADKDEEREQVNDDNSDDQDNSKD